MPQSVNVKFAKCFVIFMAIVILVQGAIYIGLSVWGIQSHNCDLVNSDLIHHPFEFVLNIIYFSSEKCGAPTIHVEDRLKDFKLEIDFAVANVINNREFIIIISYAAISSLWVVTSLLVLVGMFGRFTKIKAALCFWPWVLSVLAGSILDVVATAFHIIDITHTTSAENAFEYVGVVNATNALEFIQGYDVFFVTPAVVFTCISSRVVLIWFLNIIGSIFCLSLVRVLSSNKPEQNQHRNTTVTPIIAQSQRQLSQENNRQMQEIQRFSPTSPPSEEIRKDRRTLEPLKSPTEKSHLSEFIVSNPPPSILRQQSSTSNKRVNELKQQAIIITDTPSYQSSDSHPENLDYPNSDRYSAEPSPTRTRSVTPELSAISPLNMRYSNTEGLQFPNQPHVSEELRSQLPWSYTNIMNDPIAQKKILTHLQADDEDFPPIPVPDYTLHHPKKERATISPDRQSETGYSRW